MKHNIRLTPPIGFVSAATVAIVLATSVHAYPKTIFSATFGRAPCVTNLTVPNWYGKCGDPMPFSGIETEDPLNANNCVLSFTQIISGGDTFSELITAPRGRELILEFDYLGNPVTGEGGVIGIAEGFPGNHLWIASTSTGECVSDNCIIVPDGKWHHYAIQFDPFKPSTGIGNNGYTGSGLFHLMLELDFGSPGNAFFDNLTLRTVGGPPNK